MKQTIALLICAFIFGCKSEIKQNKIDLSDINLIIKTDTKIDSVWISNIGQTESFFLPFKDTIKVNFKEKLNDLYNVNFYTENGKKSNQLWLNGNNVIVGGKLNEKIEIDSVINSDLYYKSINFSKNYRELIQKKADSTTIDNFLLENITQNIYVDGERGLGIKSSFHKGIYLKVKGIRTYGKRYGHYGGRESQVNISSVTEIDADKSLWEFIERKIKEKGFYVYKKQKLTFPNILEEGKTYTFKSLAVCDCMLEAKRTGGYIDYTFTEKEGTAIKSRFSGRLIAKPWTYDKEPDYNWTDYQVTYESVEAESRVYDYSKFTVQVYREKYEDGSIWIAIEDYINDREFVLTEVKN